MKTVLFFRNFRRFRGGHMKIWDYFNHVLAAPGYTPRIQFSSASNWDETNPWWNAREYVVTPENTVHPDVFFVGGRNWQMLDEHPDAGADIPVINLVQHVKHVDPNTAHYGFLGRKAIRICVSEEVADAVRGTGLTRGPIVTIPNGLDLETLTPSEKAARDLDVLIVANKRPKLGRELLERLMGPGRRVEGLLEPRPREEFLSLLRAARTTVFVPNRTEGFYLPALEGMAAGTLVVCPDCVGNRTFCLPGHNSFRPGYSVDDIASAAEAALALPPDGVQRYLANAAETVGGYGLARERRAFMQILDDVERLWNV